MNILSAIEQAELQEEVVVLRLELITRVGELQKMSEEKESLKEHINRLHSTLAAVHQSLIKDVYTQHPLRGIMEDALTETSTQSIHDRDMAIAEAVREACVTAANNTDYLIDADPIYEAVQVIRSLDLEEIVKEVK